MAVVGAAAAAAPQTAGDFKSAPRYVGGLGGSSGSAAGAAQQTCSAPTSPEAEAFSASMLPHEWSAASAAAPASAAAAAAKASVPQAIALSRARDAALMSVLDDCLVVKPIIKIVIGYAGFTLIAAWNASGIDLWDAQSFAKLSTFGVDAMRQGLSITGCTGIAGLCVVPVVYVYVIVGVGGCELGC